MAEGWFLLMTERKLFGMKLGGLMELRKEEQVPVDWESIKSPPFDFCVDLPMSDSRDLARFHQYHFVYDSKVYVARGGLVSAYDIEEFLRGDKKAKAPSDKKKKKISDSVAAAAGRRGGGLKGLGTSTSIDDIRESIAHMPCCKIYQFDMRTKGFAWPGVHSVPPLLTPFAPCFLGNIIPSSGEVYCLVYHKSRRPQFEGLWVLRSYSSSGEGEQGQRQWERLSSPPPFDDEDFRGNYHQCFVSQNKLFLEVCSYQRKTALYSFDPRTAEWTPVHDHIMHSFNVMSSLNRGMTTFCFPSVTMALPGLTDCSVGLHCSCILDRTSDDDELKVMIYSLMLNNQNGAVSLCQLLDECFEGMETTYFELETTQISLADLGNGMVCALLYGCTPDHDDGDSPVLCISVFTLTVAAEQEHFVDDIDIEEEAPPQKKQTKFLNVQVHVKRLFTMRDYGDFRLLHPFVFGPGKDWIQACSKGIVYPFTGKNANKANKVSFSNRKTKKLQLVNHPKKRFWWEAGKRKVKRRLSRK